MRTPRSMLYLIIVLTLVALFLNVPRTFQVTLKTPKLPILNKSIGFDKPLKGVNPLFRFGPTANWDLDFRKGLDLEGGTSVTFKADMKDIPQDKRKSALESAKNVIENRITQRGEFEAVIQTAQVNNDYRIIAEIPGISDPNEALQLIGTTAKLTFWEQGASTSGQLTASSSALPVGIESLLGPNAKMTNLTGSDLQQAIVSFDTNTGTPQVQLTFTSDGTKKFADITRRNVGKILAIVMDNQVIEAPRVNEAITAGNAVINGDFTTEQAKNLSSLLQGGALPVPLSVLEQHGIGATLGNASLHKSLFAGVLGFIVIVVFMCALYGRLGAIASMALVVYTLLVLALFRLIPITLTLPGIAGFILSIGIAVDANILIFERMKEELRRGKTFHVAVELGFSRAWASIKDSNVASLITSGILLWLGTGTIKGFALTLAIGVLVSLFSAITVTRTLLRYFYR